MCQINLRALPVDRADGILFPDSFISLSVVQDFFFGTIHEFFIHFNASVFYEDISLRVLLTPSHIIVQVPELKHYC